MWLIHLAVVFPFIGALASQVPVINGVVGGPPVPKSGNNSRKLLLSGTVDNTTSVPVRIIENSGICETTPNVYQASGYIDIATNQSIWFWFFASRNNSDTDPLTLWFNGGPGSSSMIGLLQEHGPCRITNDSSTVTSNPYSWNNQANMLYIDQPVGTGFSHGETLIETSQDAASDIWTFMQLFFNDTRFTKYQKNDLAIWTESYGGHYGPTFAAYFLSQNEAIATGAVQGYHLNLKVLGIGNGLTDPETQYPQYANYAKSNPYYQLVPDSVIVTANNSWSASNGCQDRILACNNGGSNSRCADAQEFCNANILEPLVGPYDVYYVLAKDPDPYPPNITAYLSSVASQIGAEVTWQESSEQVYANFYLGGDWMRTSLPDLESVINAGIRTHIYDGDADYILNFMGVEAMVDKLSANFSSSTYSQQKFATWNVDGQQAGQYKEAGNFSYVRVFGAGHEVPAYKIGTLETGRAAAQMFTTVMSGQHFGETQSTSAAFKLSTTFCTSLLTVSALSLILVIF